MTTEDSKTTDEAQIRALMEARVKALHDKDISALMRDHASGIISFDVVNPLQYVGADGARKRAEEWFSSFQGPIELEMRDLTIAVSDSVAFCHSLNRVHGTTTDGGDLDMWMRATVCFRKIDGEWMDTHEHTSVPFDTKTGKASLGLKPGDAVPANAPKQSPGNYANINGLNMYYEVHGTGRPLVLLHGGFMNIEGMEPILSALAETRQVIAVELEGHGHTADLDRPLSYEQMANDVAGLLRHLGIEQADFFGFSLGGMISLRIAMLHPDLVRKLVVVSIVYNLDGYYPSVVAGWPSLSAEAFAGSPTESAYAQIAADPDHWPVFIDKVKNALLNFEGWPASDFKRIKAPTMLMLGDADVIRPEHAVEMFRLLGGGPEDGGMGALPGSQLVVLPGATHFTVLDRTDLLLSLITPFLDAPMPQKDLG